MSVSVNKISSYSTNVWYFPLELYSDMFGNIYTFTPTENFSNCRILSDTIFCLPIQNKKLRNSRPYIVSIDKSIFD
jgi:hypothetical protein